MLVSRNFRGYTLITNIFISAAALLDLRSQGFNDEKLNI
jgi:hypothetical protein